MGKQAANPAPVGPLGALEVNDEGIAKLEVLYRERYQASVRLAHLLVGDRGRAEELTQDAFVRVMPHLEGTERPTGYLRTVLVNLCRDEVRRRARAATHVHDPTPPVAPPGIPRSSTELWAALRELPERQRAALCLRYFEDLPDEEIAALLDVRPATVRSLVARGLATLKGVVPRD